MATIVQRSKEEARLKAETLGHQMGSYLPVPGKALRRASCKLCRASIEVNSEGYRGAAILIRCPKRGGAQ